MLLKQENADQSRAFQEVQKKKQTDRQTDRMTVMMGEGADQEQLITDEVCCEQCSLPMPLVCWRSKMRQHLDYLKIRSTDKDAFFQVTDNWKTELEQFIAQGGTAVQDKQWQMRYFSFTQSKIEETNKKVEVFQLSKNEQLITNDRHLTKKNIESNKEQEKETG